MSDAREMTPEQLAAVRRDVDRWVAEAAQLEVQDSRRGGLVIGERHARDLLAHVDALTARLEAAERERDEAQKTYRDWRGSEQYAELTSRADAAEKKLAELVRAYDVVDNMPRITTHHAWLAAWRDLNEALRAARGEP